MVNGGGTPAENGAGYLAALSAVAGSTAADPWVVHLEPGVYALSASPGIVPAGVRIQGSGIDVTTLTCASCIAVRSNSQISVADMTITSGATSRTIQVATARLERVVIENTNKSGDVLVASGGALTVIDSTLRTLATVETGNGQ